MSTIRRSRREDVGRSELPPDARLRLEHAGKWVAWDERLEKIVGTGNDYVAARQAAERAGHPRAYCEYLPPREEARWSGGV